MRKSLIGRTLSCAALAKDIRTLKRSTDETVRDNVRRHLADRMGKLRGLPQKIGQMISMSDDQAMGDAFDMLTDHAEPVAFETIRPTLESAWGMEVENVVATFDDEVHAASLGQVYRAKLQTGEDVAVKVAYPGIRRAVLNDLKMIGWLSEPFGGLKQRGFDMSDYRKEIVRDLEEELDYRHELSNQQRYARIVSESDHVVVPSVFPTLSSDHVLVTAWEQGDTIAEAEQWPAPEREELARRLLTHFLSTVFDHGFIHGDPHPGNYRFRLDAAKGPTIVLYDFGSVATLTESDRMTLLKLISDTGSRSGDPYALLIALGFDADLLEPIRRKLPAVCTVLFEPFCQPSKFDMESWNRTQRLDDILGDDRWNFRMAGPARLIFLLRAFRGLLFYLERLGRPISWERLLAPVLTRHQQAMADIAVAATLSPTDTFDAMAKHLRIRVEHNGATKVSLTLPAAAVEHIDTLMDEDTSARITARDIDLTEIVRNVRRSGYAPGELFGLEIADGRQIRVWIE